LLSQYNQREGNIGTVNKYRKEIFKSILKYIEEYQELNDIIIGGDMNQDTTLLEVQAFYAHLGVKDVY
jgi:hypothetical protein